MVHILEAYFESGESNVFLEDLSKESAYEDMQMTTVGEHTRAFIKIQDGCNQFCTYCIIPYARGPVRSLPLTIAVEQTKELRAEGYHEIVITGIEISSWGKDLKTGESLIDLVEAVCDATGLTADKVTVLKMK